MRSMSGLFPGLAPRKKGGVPPAGNAGAAKPAGAAKADLPYPGAGRLTAKMIDSQLQNLMDNAKSERLECAVSLIEALQISLAADQASVGAPPGTLTVRGWWGLLGRWERHLQAARLPQVKYARPFFQEAMKGDVFSETPMVALFQELVEMMEQTMTQAMEPAG